MQYSLGVVVYEGYDGEVADVPVVAQGDAVCCLVGGAMSKTYLFAPKTIDCGAVHVVMLIARDESACLQLWCGDVALGNP